MFKLNIKQRGIGLLELMLALAIIAILLVMATRYFLTTSRSEQVNRATTQVGVIVAGVNNWKSSRQNYEGVSGTELHNIGAIPEVEWSGTAIYSPWNTNITVAPTSGNDQFVITYAGIPSWACNALKQKYDKTQDQATTACTATGDTGTFTYTSK